MHGERERSYLVLDIETVPDPELYAPPIVEPGSERPFPPLCAHRPIVIGALWLDPSYGFRHLNAFGKSQPAAGIQEHDLLEQFSEFMDRHRPDIITFNGRGFDLPVLVLRSLRHGVPMGWYYQMRDYRYRFSEEGHLDLCDFLSEHGAASGRGLTLDTAAKLVGLPGKVGVDGSQVEGMYKAAKLEAIRNYCLADVVQTAFLFLRFRLLTGRLAVDEYREVAQALLEHLRRDPRVSELLARVDEGRLLLGSAPGAARFEALESAASAAG